MPRGRPFLEEGAGRAVKLSVRLAPSQIALAERVAARQGVSRGAIVRAALDRYFAEEAISA